VTFWERAAGQTARPLQPVAPPRAFAATKEFTEPVETLEPLLFVLRRFVDRLALELRTAGLVAAELAIHLGLDDETAHARSFRLPEPTADADILFRALHTHLETLRTDAPIEAVRLDLTPTRPLEKQQDLFETGLRDPHGFAETLARTVAVVGSGHVGTPRLLDTHRTDAVELAPSADVVPPAVEAPIHAPLGLPLRRFRPPLAAKIELAGRAPAYVWCERLHGPVATARGPWRGAGDWWHAELAWEHEEWDVALAGGGLYRVLRTPAGWFVGGEYD
jgi:protein ImuB